MMTHDKGQQATLPAVPRANATNYGATKETIETRTLVVLDDDMMHKVVVARLYRSRRGDGSTPMYAAIWIRTRDGRMLSGRGSAGGCGYCKRSAAIGQAVTSAGVRLAVDIEGRGMGAVDDALHAIANAAGYSDCHVREIV